jgi:hypothetical protein
LYNKEIQLSDDWVSEALSGLIQSFTTVSVGGKEPDSVFEISNLVCIFLLVSGNSLETRELANVLDLKEILLRFNSSNQEVADISCKIISLL